MLLSQQRSFYQMDVTVQVTALLGSTVQSGIGGAVFAAIISSVFSKNLKPALGIIGNISIGGAIERAINFNDKVSILSETEQRRYLVPMDNLQNFLLCRLRFWARLMYLLCQYTNDYSEDDVVNV